MDLKDALALSISSLALAFSIAAFVITTRLRRSEISRALRLQLGDLVGKMIEATRNLQEASRGTASLTAKHIEAVSALRQELTALARQAKYLIDQRPEAVSDVEYATTAQAFFSAGELIPARELWPKAIAASPNSYAEVINRRGYANFLFGLGLVKEGREEFKRAAGMDLGHSDLGRTATAYTHHMWMVSEFLMGNDESAEEQYQLARETLLKVSNPMFRDGALRVLDDERVQVRSAREDVRSFNREPPNQSIAPEGWRRG